VVETKNALLSKFLEKIALWRLKKRRKDNIKIDPRKVGYLAGRWQGFVH
jgi:hypothetical protein